MLFSLESKRPKAVEVTTAPLTPVLMRADIALAEAFPCIEHGRDYAYATAGDWSTMDLITHILRTTGPASLTASTWSVSEAAVINLTSAIQAGALTEVHFLVDWRVSVRTPSFMAIARQKFADVRVTTCHAKVFVLSNQEWAISCVGSANFTSNPRIEAGYLSTNPQIADFHTAWIMAEINRADPFGLDIRKRGKRRWKSLKKR